MKIFDEKGITLIELLTTVTILMIVLPIIYGVFTSGLKLYNKIQIEGQLRDDADYAVTMIMNTFYSFPFDEVQQCGSNCIELIDNKYTKVEKVSKDKSFYGIQQKAEKDSETRKVIKFIPDSDGKTVLSIDGKMLDDISGFSNVSLSYTCDNSNISLISSNCENGGIIDIELQFNNSRLEKPYTLTSQFGF
ncbi:PilW family protein [Bacillus rubiinfantis]|uniref:PilW family protein n=1 Tax=Bacillus rubiinfantis TaxID=1499680 RepID=UPI0005A74C26|nr:prepilin-type N-terminal cleavage/methylation domain-containing protein [Bacillus rubiinfantis]